MQKDIKKWYSRLTRTGKILLYAAGVALVYLLLALINRIFGIVNVDLGVFGIILNVVAILLILFVVLQAAAIIYMMREENEMYREMMTKGRRRGNSMEQAAGRRSQASMTKRGAQSAQMHVRGILTVDNINQKYPAKWYKRPSVVTEWKEIKEPGIYALDSENKPKVEIIDASEVGGGFFVGTWEGNRFLKYKRKLILNKRTGRPQSFSSLRNAKKQLSKVT
ncbi:MAG: hypothetical protein GY943_25835 [Chloroflexi bacterium]|nr:hypothetical protein [Chloroflexota bacterium]